MRRFLALATVVLACMQVEGKSVSPHAQDAVQTIEKLRAIGLPDFEAGQAGPPARVPALLRKLNEQLRALITETVNNRSGTGIGGEREVIGELKAAGWKEIPRYKWNAYGEISQIRFATDSYESGLLVVSTELWVPCGSTDPDTALYVFAGNEKDWKLVLATDADYDTTGASEESGMQYRVSPRAADGSWYLAVVQAPPACGPTSAAASLRYKVLRPGPSPDEPRILLDRSEPLNEKFEPPFRLEVMDDWFAVTKGKERKLDGEPGVSVARYRVIGDELTRIQPLAPTPEDFVDEWVQLDWSEAVRASGQSSELAKWHATLNALAYDSTEIEFVQPCRAEGRAEKTWLAGLWIDQQLNPHSENERLYIVVSERQRALFVDSVNTTRPAGCPGKARPLLTNWELPQW